MNNKNNKTITYTYYSINRYANEAIGSLNLLVIEEGPLLEQRLYSYTLMNGQLPFAFVIHALQI